MYKSNLVRIFTPKNAQIILSKNNHKIIHGYPAWPPLCFRSSSASCSHGTDLLLLARLMSLLMDALPSLSCPFPFAREASLPRLEAFVSSSRVRLSLSPSRSTPLPFQPLPCSTTKRVVAPQFRHCLVFPPA
jgi:hypothetical protein